MGGMSETTGNRIWWGLAVVGLLLGGAAAVALHRVPRLDIRLEFTGAPGQRLQVEYVSDGIPATAEVTVPGELRFEARELAFQTEPVEGTGRTAVRMIANRVERLNAAADDGLVYGYIRNGRWGLKGRGMGTGRQVGN